MIARLVRHGIRFVPYGLRDFVRKIPLIAGLQRFLIRQLASEGEFDHTIDAGPARGLNLKISLPRDKEMWKGTYELRFVGEIVRNIKPGDVCFDIGGWSGYVAACMALAGASRVSIFEPMPDNLARIESLMRMNPNLSLDVHPYALGAMSGPAELTYLT